MTHSESTTTRILDGKAIAGAIRADVASGVRSLLAAGGRKPCLAAVLAGDNPASQMYVGMKARACEEVGMEGRTIRLSGSISRADLETRLDQLSDDDGVDGILLQLPLPGDLPERAMLAHIDPDKDVDGLHTVNVGRLWLGEDGFAPATPSGVIEILHRSGVAMAGRRAVIVGRSSLVGKPMAALLLAENATVTVCHSKTRDLPAVCREADILIAAIGRAAMIGPEHVKPGAVVIDVGTTRVTDRATVEHLYPDDPGRLARFDEKGSTVVGDVDFTRVASVASAITPVPGGVGPLTVAMLLVNTLEASRRRQGIARA